ncbi:hypothetical protein Q3G72_034115 [Acer saccharum]|nr:hypothetical protein Q3G72_034115 [Acer saccharum]
MFTKPEADPKTVASIILGGGGGTRLFPLTGRRAKPVAKLSASGDESWKDREADVLALGAIAEDCISVLYPHLSENVEFIKNNGTDRGMSAACPLQPSGLFASV